MLYASVIFLLGLTSSSLAWKQDYEDGLGSYGKAKSYHNKCDDGYWNDNGYCKKCSVNYCKVCQPPNGYSCTQCQHGYELKSGYCHSKYPGSGDVDIDVDIDNDVDIDVDQEPKYEDGATRKLNSYDKKYSYDKKCDDGYWNDNGHCKKCKVNSCKVCQPPNGYSCTQCQHGYELKSGYCHSKYPGSGGGDVDVVVDIDNDVDVDVDDDDKRSSTYKSSY